ncbi:hypothetical protein PAAG_11762 [Paracoccidioides lutzii Pb01]|uniref:Uncharacterized protein n=1 Tax=Paracoccidioides lutzii (strain ATCC MYA-826 / Pb01) TaxID=502779 RepID=A0A0A2V5W3_PARBA|nr:hypothetical protein PAAG_11762 [Paracoccidioides lutzii Pb01]KGQ01525.1 hypothetical protein PAAG_11762 [Paracoccidioides lutzii Pb01]
MHDDRIIPENSYQMMDERSIPRAAAPSSRRYHVKESMWAARGRRPEGRAKAEPRSLCWTIKYQIVASQSSSLIYSESPARSHNT